MSHRFMFDRLCKYLGQTVTIFTESGGLSGSGFTGVLASVDDDVVKLIINIGTAPSCAISSSCFDGRTQGFGYEGFGYDDDDWDCDKDCHDKKHRRNRFGNRSGYGSSYGYYNVGAVAEIPIDKIVNFVHHSI